MKVYFFTAPHGPATRACYDHQLVALAEGLLQKPHEISGKHKFYPLFEGNRSHLIEHEHFSYSESDVVVFSSEIFDGGHTKLLPSDLYSSNRKYKLVFLDNSDGLKTPGFRPEIRNVDIVLKSHFNSWQKYPDNFVPWQYGLTNRLIEYAALNANKPRKHTIMESFRVDHGTRTLAHRYFIPLLDPGLEIDETREEFDKHHLATKEQKLWEITGRRHYPSYYQRLGSSLACAAFGGTIQPSWLFGDIRFRSHISRVNDLFTHGRSGSRILQWDSYRFWESLISGCATIHVDLNIYGAILPVMPINFQHYIGVDFKKVKKAVTVTNDLPQISRIAKNGQEWALENYSPVAIANRFLSLIDSI